jgi:EAL domain-containing protein (putative c-di-GMP-specific phosphodiesterase class I)
MVKLITVFISAGRQRLLGIGLWLPIFLLLLAGAAWFAANLTSQAMMEQAEADVAPISALAVNVETAFAALGSRATAAPCSAEFHQQLREIAYLPDGLNEFLSVPGGVVGCSVETDLAQPFALGPPDLATATGDDTAYWFDRKLDFIGLRGQSGTIALRSGLGIVVPTPKPLANVPNWLHEELVRVLPDGRWTHLGGIYGVYAQQKASDRAAWLLSIDAGAFHQTFCDAMSLNCVSTSASLAGLLQEFWPYAVIVACLLAVVAAGVSGQLHRAIRHYWSFESRFRRHFRLDHIVCAYQPIMNLSTGRIDGCEVLARWRDLDDRVIFPDQFLPTVKKFSLSVPLTRLVIAKAQAELSATLPTGTKLQVNFNIFPGDLNAEVVRDMLAVFDLSPHRFDLAVEIIESDELVVATAQPQIDALHHHGIKVYLDDFGTGYSSIENIATLPFDGVKLDRAFAMAPDNTLMGAMLQNAINLILAAGRRVVVEGIETESRLGMLKEMQVVDHVQGYLISRPLDIVRFARFLGAQRAEPVPAMRLVA